MALIRKETGIGWLGWTPQLFKASPWWLQGYFASIEIYDDYVLFGLPLRKYTCSINDIKSVERIFSIPFNGVELRFRNPELPSFFVFWTIRAKQITAILQELCRPLEIKRPWYRNPIQVFSLLPILIFLLVLVLSIRIYTI
jgi:hypothetical protein